MEARPKAALAACNSALALQRPLEIACGDHLVWPAENEQSGHDSWLLTTEAALCIEVGDNASTISGRD